MTHPDSREVERVARAIACVRHGGEPNDDMPDFMWIAYVDDARAALATTGTRVTELEAALRAARKLIGEIDEYQKRPERGDYGVECACCMGELLDDDRDVIATIARALDR